MLTPEQEAFLATFADGELARVNAETQRISTEEALRAKIAERDAAKAALDAKQKLEAVQVLQPFEDEIAKLSPDVVNLDAASIDLLNS